MDGGQARNIDPSGGSNDSMTLAVAHVEGKLIVLDAIREVVPPFSPNAVVEQLAEVLRRYQIFMVYGDKYGGLWCREPFIQTSVQVRHLPGLPAAVEQSRGCVARPWPYAAAVLGT